MTSVVMLSFRCHVEPVETSLHNVIANKKVIASEAKQSRAGKTPPTGLPRPLTRARNDEERQRICFLIPDSCPLTRTPLQPPPARRRRAGGEIEG